MYRTLSGAGARHTLRDWGTTPQPTLANGLVAKMPHRVRHVRTALLPTAQGDQDDDCQQSGGRQRAISTESVTPLTQRLGSP